MGAEQGRSLRRTFGLVTPGELQQLDRVAAAENARAEAGPRALDELAYWTERARFLTHLHEEAAHKAREAAGRCTDAGVPQSEIARRFTPPSRGETPAGGSFFGVAYFESGPDMDGDGDVDGGLFDTLGDLF
jgi:hypothetical protein